MSRTGKAAASDACSTVDDLVIADDGACSSFDIWYAQGETFANQQDYLKALRCFEEAAILRSADLEVLVYQAVCWIHLERPAKALTITDKVLAQAPDHSQGWLFQGVALHRLGRYSEAYASYDRAVGQPPALGRLAQLKHFLMWFLLRC